MSESAPVCITCNRTSDEIPLLRLEFHNKVYYICPQHLPTLIHKPLEMADKFPGMHPASE